MKPIIVSPVSLLLGVLLAVGLFLVMGQAGPTSYGTWGPPKKGVVNVFQPNSVSIPPGGAHVVYQVPSDRWFTATGVFALNGATMDLRWSEGFSGVFADKGFAMYTLPQVSFGDTQNLMINPQAAGGTVGWVFRPGSEVVLRNVGSLPATVQYHALTGYESRD